MEDVAALSSSSDEDDEDAPQKITPCDEAAASSSSHSQFYQLRSEGDPDPPWALSFEQMLEPAHTITHALVATFGHAHEQLDELRQRLEAASKQLQHICVVSDWNNTGGVGATAAGPIDGGDGYQTNPHIYIPLPEETFGHVPCTVVFPPLCGDEPKARPVKGRRHHSIQHTKLLLVRHTAGGGLPAHLRVHIMSCNIDNLLGHRDGCGDVIWRSPPLPELPACNPLLVVPGASDAAWRFGAPLYSMLSSMMARAAELAEGSHVREWARMLASYDLARVPPDVHLTFTMPGPFPRDRVAFGGEDASGMLGHLGGRLKCWDYEEEMAANLDELVTLARGPLGMGPTGPYTFGSANDGFIWFVLEPENEHDDNAILVYCTIDNTERVIGRLSRRDAACLTPLLRAGLVEVESKIEIVLRPPKPAPKQQSKGKAKAAAKGGASSKLPVDEVVEAEAEEEEGGEEGGDEEGNGGQKIVLSEALQNASVYIDVTVFHCRGDDTEAAAAAVTAAPDMWLDLAACLRTSFGIGRVREVLKATGPWPREERTAFASVSASVGHEIRFMRCFASAVDGTEDVDAWPRPRLEQRMLGLGLPLPEGRDKNGKHREQPTVAQLLAALRPHVQPGATPPSLILPTGHAAGALMGNPAAFNQFLHHHRSCLEAGAPPFLHDLDIDHLGGASSVHPRVLDHAGGFAQRLVHSHSKIIVGRYRVAAAAAAAAASSSTAAPPLVGAGGSQYGWTYIGSHNFSPTSWGDPRPKVVEQETRGSMLEGYNWEVGVMLTVPRETPPTEADRRMAFDAWPTQFDVANLVPYGDEEAQRAQDNFLHYQAMKAVKIARRVDGIEDEAELQRIYRDAWPPEARSRMPTLSRPRVELQQLEEAFIMQAKAESLRMHHATNGEEADEVEDYRMALERSRADEEKRQRAEEVAFQADLERAKVESASMAERKRQKVEPCVIIIDD